MIVIDDCDYVYVSCMYSAPILFDVKFELNCMYMHAKLINLTSFAKQYIVMTQ